MTSVFFYKPIATVIPASSAIIFNFLYSTVFKILDFGVLFFPSHI